MSLREGLTQQVAQLFLQVEGCCVVVSLTHTYPLDQDQHPVVSLLQAWHNWNDTTACCATSDAPNAVHVAQEAGRTSSQGGT